MRAMSSAESELSSTARRRFWLWRASFRVSGAGAKNILRPGPTFLRQRRLRFALQLRERQRPHEAGELRGIADDRSGEKAHALRPQHIHLEGGADIVGIGHGLLAGTDAYKLVHFRGERLAPVFGCRQ